LVALPSGDAEREAAFDHARTCHDCTRQLEDARAVLAVLDDLPPLPRPTAAVLRRVERSVLSELSATSATSATSPARPLAALVVAWIVFATLARQHAHAPLVWAESLATLGVAAGGVVVLPRLREKAVVVLCAASAALVLLAHEGDALGVMLGLKCVATELLAAALPYAAVAHAAIKRHVAADPVVFGGIAAAGALAGDAALHVACPMRAATTHLLLFHFGAVLLAAMLGALGAARVTERATSR
jgi:hypothetical protein